MVVEIEAKGEKALAMICECGYCGLCVSSKEHYYPLDCVNDDLKYGNCVFTKVYGLSNNTYDAYKLSTDSRKLLWERPKYYNGKVICVNSHSPFLTKGKIYEFKDGSVTYNSGRASDFKFKDFDAVCRYYKDTFIELVE